MQDSVECVGLQKHNGESLVFIHCMVLEIQLFFLIPYSKVSCFVEALHLVEDVQNNGCISVYLPHNRFSLYFAVGH